MSPLEINNGLSVNEYSAAMIAEILDVSPATISQVISRVCDSKRIAIAIAKSLDLPIQTVFPDKPQYHPGYSRSAKRTNKLNQLRQQLAS